MEAGDQRGMAHFLEHLAFCGTKDFAAGETIEYFQRLGMKFGADTNASTIFDKTVYKLELPRANEEVVGEGLKLFRNFLDGMQLDAHEIDRERNVVLSEIRASDSAEYRAGLAGLKVLAPDSFLSQRNVLGSTTSVQSLPRARFVDFYETWYTPARATVVAVGDFDPQLVRKLIENHFQDAKARRGEQPNPNFGSVATGQGVSAFAFANSDLQDASISINVAGPAVTKIQTVSSERQEMARSLANAMINFRLAKIAAGASAPIQSASAGFLSLFKLADSSSISATCSRDQWRAGLSVVEQELRRALAYGFTDAEFNEIKQYPLTAYRSQAEQAETRQPADLADQIISTLSKNFVFTHPADDAALATSILSDLKKEDCLKALHEAWDSHELKIWLKGNLTLTGDGTKEILDAWRTSQQVAVKPIDDQQLAPWAYTDFGPAGVVAKRTNLDDLQITQAVFQNNVHVNIKRTTVEKNKILVSVRFGGGLLDLPLDKLGLDHLANVTFISGGLQAHSIQEINRLLADKDVSVRFVVNEDAFLLAGNCSPKALQTQFQVIAAYLTAPGYRTEAQHEFLTGLDSLYTELDHTVGGAAVQNVYPFLRSGDPRFATPNREIMQTRTLDELKSWLAQPLASGYLEVTIVGDVDPDLAMQAVASTLGALPEREAAKPIVASQRALHFPSGHPTKEFQFTSQTPCALSVVSWPTSGSRDVSQDARARVLADILNDRLRLKVRTDLGATYTPSVVRYSSDAFPDFGYMQAGMTVDPNQAQKISSLVAEIADNLATGSISDDEFQRALKPVLASLDEVVKDNVYWLNTLADSQEHPEVLEAARNIVKNYQSITKPEIEALAKQLLSADKATTISLIPTEAK